MPRIKGIVSSADDRTNILAPIAEFIGVKPSTLVSWSRLPDFPKQGPDGKWLVADIAEFRDARLEAENPDYQQAKARRMKAQADREELRLAEERNELIPAHEVEATWSKRLADFCGIVDKNFVVIAPMLEGKDAPTILKRLRETFTKAREESAKI